MHFHNGLEHVGYYVRVQKSRYKSYRVWAPFIRAQNTFAATAFMRGSFVLHSL